MACRLLLAEARLRADGIAAEKSLRDINGYDDPAIIAGQGTLGLEIGAQVPDVEAVIVPIGGAGLVAGLALALKILKLKKGFGYRRNERCEYPVALDKLRLAAP